MAESKAAKGISKDCLKNATMYTYHIRRVTRKMYLSWNVVLEGHSQLKDNVSYTRKMAVETLRLNLHLTVIQKRGDLTAIVPNSAFGPFVKCYVRYDDNTFSSAIYPKRHSEKGIELQISSKIINHPKNVYLKNGNLILSFLYEYMFRPLTTIYPTTVSRNDKRVTFCRSGTEMITDKSEQEVIHENLSSYASSTYTKNNSFCDFSIQGKDSPYHFHKSFLATRSKFFYEYLKSGKSEIELTNTTDDAVALILQFLYFGKIPTTKGTQQDILDVLKLSLKWRVTGLNDICTTFLECSVGESNALIIKKAGEELGIQSLVVEADRHL